MRVQVGDRFAEVDECDFAEVSKHEWHLMRNGGHSYAVRRVLVDGKYVAVLMHRQILGAKSGEFVDHRDRDGLNNSRANIRICSHAENMRNRAPSRTNKAGFKGVYFDARCPLNPWRAQIRSGGKKFTLGFFATPEEAHAAYAIAASEKHGEFARLAA